MRILFLILLTLSAAFAETCPSGDQACAKRNAEAALKEGEASGEITKQISANAGLVGGAGTAAGVAVPLMIGYVMLKKSARHNISCAAPSIYSMIAGGVALFAGNLLANSGHKSRLKEIQTEWDDLIAKSNSSGAANSTEAQSQAFEFLARREDSMEKAAKMKATIFGVATAAFGASAVLATLEVMRLDQTSVICNRPPGSEATDAVDETAPDAADVEVIIVTGPALSGLSRFLLKPLTRAVFSGVMTAWSGVMAIHSSKVAKNAKSRAEALRKMKTEFDTGSGDGLATGAATDPAGAGGGSASVGVNGSGSTAAGNRAAANDELIGTCFTRTGDVDQSCACKKNNTCLGSGIQSFNLDQGTLSAVGSSLAQLDQLGNGTLGAASVNANSATATAGRLLAMANKHAGKTREGQNYLKARPGVASSISSQFASAASNIQRPLSSALASSLPFSPAAAAAQLETPVSKATAVPAAQVAEKATTIPGTATVSEADFTFTEGEQVAEMMKKDDFEYQVDDVNKDKTDSIFKVLSNRYQSVGRRRLLAE
jgi:hypothetical protein